MICSLHWLKMYFALIEAKKLTNLNWPHIEKKLTAACCLGEQTLNLDEQEGFVRQEKSITQKTGNSHMRSTSPTEVPFYPSNTGGEKAIANWMTSKAMKVDELLCCHSYSWTQNASMSWCLSSGRDVCKACRLKVPFFHTASSLSSSCYEIHFSIVNVFDVLV